MPNIFAGQVLSSAPTQAAANSSSGILVPANTERHGLVLVNISTSTVYLSFGLNTAVLGSGITLLPSGGTWGMDDYTFSRENINGISHVDGSAVSVQEFYVKW